MLKFSGFADLTSCLEYKIMRIVDWAADQHSRNADDTKELFQLLVEAAAVH